MEDSRDQQSSSNTFESSLQSSGTPLHDTPVRLENRCFTRCGFAKADPLLTHSNIPTFRSRHPQQPVRTIIGSGDGSQLEGE